MRVVTKHKHNEQDSDAYDQKYMDQLPESNLPAPVPVAGTLVSPLKVEKEYPAEAVKQYHNKPMPKHDKHVVGGPPKQHIQQPRK